MLRSSGVHVANLLTALRLAVTPLFVAAIWCANASHTCGVLAGALFALAAASDVMDGRAARRWGSASIGGRAFDHLADIGFILTALSAYTCLGVVPWWVPAAIGASFASYVLDSWFRAAAGSSEPLGSRIGHVAGILNYSLVGVVVFNDSAGIHLLSPAMLAKLFWLVPIYSVTAVVARLAVRRAVVSIPGAA